VLEIGLSNVLELEFPIVANEPAYESEEELAEGRVDIKEVGSLEVIGSKLAISLVCGPSGLVHSSHLAEMYFIKYNFIRVVDAQESSEE
jgi:hypothetical protein